MRKEICNVSMHTLHSVNFITNGTAIKTNKINWEVDQYAKQKRYKTQEQAVI